MPACGAPVLRDSAGKQRLVSQEALPGFHVYYTLLFYSIKRYNIWNFKRRFELHQVSPIRVDYGTAIGLRLNQPPAGLPVSQECLLEYVLIAPVC